MSPKDLIKKIVEKTIFVGDGVKTYGALLVKSLSSLALFPDPSLHLPRGSVVARLGNEHLRRGESLDVETLAPIYVRPSEAEIKWQEKHLI
jgi:tRNA threonylcarbamoyladenosine biosynthesis protein TsaB